VTIVAPVELARRPQWVAWRLQPREGQPKPTKVPYDARTGRLASTTDPSTWATFEEAATFCSREHCSGVGYVLSADDPYVGVDLDACRDPASGRISGWAKAIIKRLNSYTEISPSGTGLRIFVRGELPAHGRRKGSADKPPAIEVYSQARFLTITGDHVLGLPETIQDRQDALLAWHMEVFGPAPEQRQNGHSSPGTSNRQPVHLADADLLLKARAADNGAKFWAVWNGDVSGHGGDDSAADLALLNHLAFWTGPDPARLDQLFRSSGLMREKWERADYRERTINKALEGRTEFYDPSHASPRLGGTPASETQLVDGSPQTDYRLVQIAHVLAADDRAIVQLIEGLLWKRRVHWIFADAGTGKTLWCLAQHLHIAAGKPFLGRAVIQGAVALIEEDSPLDTAVEYAETLADIYGIDLDQIPFFMNDLQGLRLTDDVGITRARAAIAACPEKPVAVILDAAERFVPSDKFTSRELDGFDRFLKGLINDDIVPTVIDHINRRGRAEEGTKPTKKPDPLSLLYGGQSKHAISDVMVFLDGKLRDEPVHASWQKFRVSGAKPPDFTIRFDEDKGFSLDEHRQQPVTDAQRAVMRHLEVYGDWRTKAQVMGGTDLPDKRCQRALNALVTQRWAETVGTTNDRRWRLRPDAPVAFS
jgi:putative DNA primase/helicase